MFNHFWLQSRKPFLIGLLCLCISTLNACVITHSHHGKSLTSADAQNSLSITTDAIKGKNIILFLGDGMGISTVTAARIFAGQQLGMKGEEHQLSFEKFPNVALSKTYNTDQQVPDSAGTMSAIVTGIKTRAGVLSVQAEPGRGDCDASMQRGATSILELAELAGLKTGIISTARITHATPGATYAHTPDRNWENDAELPKSAQQAGCKDIARQLIEFPFGDGPEIVLGGGRANFLPVGVNDPEYSDLTGLRQDGRHLTQEWQQRKNAQYVWNQAQFKQALQQPAPILGLFEPSHMQFEHDRNQSSDGEPSLTEMITAAIKRLAGHKEGYLLIVEGGRIDHAHHGSNAYRALSETVALSDAVAAAVSLTDSDDTLIVVTADHSHVFTMAGYPARGNPILGLVHGHNGADQRDEQPTMALDDMPYTTLGYANGPGYHEQGRGSLTDAQVQNPDYQQYGAIPSHSETHGGEDVAIYARGPGAMSIHGVMEQNTIFYAMINSQPELARTWKDIQTTYGWPVDPKQLLTEAQ